MGRGGGGGGGGGGDNITDLNLHYNRQTYRNVQTTWKLFSAAFDTVDHNILITRLRSTFGCSDMVLDWFSYLSCRTQSVFVGHEPTLSVLQCGMPQGSILGSLLFTLYTHPLSTVICQSGLSYHFFADDSQLHKSSVPFDFSVLACCLKDCIEDVAE